MRFRFSPDTGTAASAGITNFGNLCGHLLAIATSFSNHAMCTGSDRSIWTSRSRVIFHAHLPINQSVRSSAPVSWSMLAARCILQAHADIVSCTSNHAPLFADREVTAFGAYACMPLAPFSADDVAMRDDRVRLTTFLLSKMRALGLRKRQGTTALYKGVLTEDKRQTYTFAPYKFTMEQFVYRHCRRDDAYNMWSATIRNHDT